MELKKEIPFDSPSHQQRKMAYLSKHGMDEQEQEHLPNLLSSSSSRGRFLAFCTAGFAFLTLSPTTTQPSHAMTVDPKSGIRLPDKGEIEAAVPKDWTTTTTQVGENDDGLAIDDSSMLTRLDSTNDAIFYKEPRFVEHVDAQAVDTMTRYISNVLEKENSKRVLDLCSSWTSHVDDATAQSLSLTRFAGLGMNAKELQANKVLTEWTVQDLNEKPVLPYGDASFDTVLCQLSIDYLTKPLEVCKEIGRVLSPGGTVHILFSNRVFISKAVALWTGADDIDHAYTVASYLHFCKGGFDNIQARDLSIRKGRDNRIIGDPVYVVTGVKKV